MSGERDFRLVGRARTTTGMERRCLMAVGGRDHWCWAFVDGVDDLGVVDPLQVDRGDREVRVLDMRVIWQACRGSAWTASRTS